MARKILRSLGFVLVILLAVAVGILPFWQVGLSAEPADASQYTVKGGDSLYAIAKVQKVDVEKLAEANGLAPNSILYRQQKLIIPESETAVSASMVAAAPAPRVNSADLPAGTVTYKVKAGDTLYSIAKDKRVDVEELAEANGLAPNSILYRQQILVIPESETAVSASVVAAAPAPRVSTADLSTGTVTYKVKAGDSLYSIAKKLRVDVEALAQANGLTPNSILYRQQILIVPSAATTAAAPSAAPAADAAAAPTAEPTAEATQAAAEEPVAEEPAADATPEPTEEAAAAEEADIVDTALAAGNFSFLIAALDAAGLTEALRGEGPFTLFAPVDGAFAALPASQLQALLDDPAGDLTQILLYHVVPGAILAGEISDGATAVTLQGEELSFTVDGESVKVNDANVITTDVFATNGVIHVIDSVLVPPSIEADAAGAPSAEATAEPAAEATAEPTEEPTAEATVEPAAEPTAVPTEEPAPEATAAPTEEPVAEPTVAPTEEPAAEGASGELPDIIDTAVAAGGFTTLIAAVEAAGLVDALKGEGPFTVFAPTDAAFSALPAGTLDALLADPTGELTQILLYHVVPETVLAADLVDGMTLPTLQGGELTVSITPEGATVNGINIVTTDIATSNGVIHVIDAVLIPLEDQASAPNSPLTPANEAASIDAASLIILPAPQIDAAATAALWPVPSGNLAVFSPVEGGAYHSPLAVIGLARTTEGFVTIDLVDSAGQVLAQRATQSGTTDYAFFSTALRFTVSDVTSATLNIVEMDLADGAVLSELSVPVTLIPGQRVIDVTAPVVGQLACDQVLVSGYSSTHEANVVLTLLESLGTQLEQMPATGGAFGNYRDFVATFDYTNDQPVPLLASFEETDASGRFPSIDKTVVPLILYPAYSAVCR